MENAKKQMQQEADEIRAQLVRKEITIGELAKQLEAKEIAPVALGKLILVQCALYFKSRGYSSEEIADILKCDVRTVQRYVQTAREDNLSAVDLHFQKIIAGEFINNWRSQSQRLLKLSYSDEIKDIERAKIIYMLHQLEINGITILERLGYLSKEQGIVDRKEEEKEYEFVANNVKVKEAVAILRMNTEKLMAFQGPAEEWAKLYGEVKDQEKNLWEIVSSFYDMMYKDLGTAKYRIKDYHPENN